MFATVSELASLVPIWASSLNDHKQGSVLGTVYENGYLFNFLNIYKIISQNTAYIA